MVKHARKIDDLPTPHYTEVFNEIKNQTDRGVAIIGAAYIDLVLRQAISARLRQDKDLMEELFENRGPLQEFGSRISIAFAMGICGLAARVDLRTIKNIRNVFAHSAEAMDFDRHDIAQLCETLWYPKRVRYPPPRPKTPRERFIRAIEVLADLLLEDVNLPKGKASNPLIMAAGSFAPKTAKK